MTRRSAALAYLALVACGGAPSPSPWALDPPSDDAGELADVAQAVDASAPVAPTVTLDAGPDDVGPSPASPSPTTSSTAHVPAPSATPTPPSPAPAPMPGPTAPPPPTPPSTDAATDARALNCVLQDGEVLTCTRGDEYGFYVPNSGFEPCGLYTPHCPQVDGMHCQAAGGPSGMGGAPGRCM